MQWLLAAIAVTACSAARIQRLPTAVWPTQYTLDIATDPLGDNFTGNVTIEAEVREDTDNITLHARRLTLGAARLQLVDQEQGVTETEVMVVSDAETDLVVVTVSNSLRQGAHLRLTLPFSGELSKHRQRGYYRIKTGEQDWEWMSGTVFEMNHARDAFPCFDEPQFKAHFRLNLAHHSNHTTLSNMPVVSSSTLEEDGWLVDHFDNSPLMPSYLVAYHLLQWDHREVKTDDGRPLRVWAPSKLLRWANKSLDFAPRALAWLQDYTGVNEPMPKIDFVAVPRFPGALENWGVISFVTSAVLYKPRSDGMLRETFYAQLIAHELAHSWFGNLITPQWWDSIWLSEGSASFFASLAVDQLEPSWDQFAEESESQLSTTYFDNAADIKTRPLSEPLEDSLELRHIQQSNYYKGFSLLRMLYFTLGSDHFREGIRRYVSRQQFGSARPKDLFDSFQYNYNGTDLNELMYSWTYQQGLPVVTAHRSQGQLFLSQERFRINCENCTSITAEEKWWVPISYTTRSDQNVNSSEPKLWFREDMSIPDPAKPEDWLLLNLNAAGTYHVRYDKENLELIMNAITKNPTEIPTYSKFQIVTDYGLFALEDSSSLNDVLDVMEFLSKETHFAPWASALNTFWRIDGRLKGTPAGIKFQDRVRDLLTPEFNRLGLRPRKGESMATVRQRKQIVEHACLYQLPDCVVRSGAYFQKWMKQQKPDKVNPIPPELQFTVYCSAMRYGSINQWHFLKERALAAKDAVHRETLFSALGCSNKYHLLYGLMNNELNNSTMTRTDFTRVLQGLVNHNNDIGPVLTYMQDSMVKIKSTSKKKMRWNKTMLRDLSHQIVDPAQLEQITMMISSSKVWPESEVATVKQQVESNIKWRQKYMNAL